MRLAELGNDHSVFHDYEILSLVHEPRDETLQLAVRAPSGEVANLVLRGCSVFRVCDFIRQNVIERIIFTSGPEENEDVIRKSLGWMASLTDSASYMMPQTVTKVLGDIRSGDMILVECVPSYGAEIVALCRSYEVVLVSPGA